jgi:hypothetical protein
MSCKISIDTEEVNRLLNEMQKEINVINEAARRIEVNKSSKYDLTSVNIFHDDGHVFKTSALQFASSVSLSINAIISELTLLERMSDMLVEANKNLGK